MDPVLCRIDEMRKQLHLSKSEFSRKLDMSGSNYGQWMRGDTNSYMKKLPQISAILGCSVDYLITGKESFPETLYRAYRTAPENLQRSICEMLRLPYEPS